MFIPIFCCTTALIVGMLLGSLVAGDYARKTMWATSKQFEKQAEVIKQFQEAATPIVRELESAGEDTDWKDGPETDRVYPWYEIEPLAKVLSLSRALYQEQELKRAKSHSPA